MLAEYVKLPAKQAVIRLPESLAGRMDEVSAITGVGQTAAMHADDYSQNLTSMTENVMDQIFRVLFINSDKKYSRQILDRGQIGGVEIECRFQRTQQRGSIHYIGFGIGHLLSIPRMVR
jgi:hypothetical protein